MSRRVESMQIGVDIQDGRRAENERLTRERDDALTRLRIEKECRAANKYAVVDTVGGVVEGHPTNELNYLQRLQELVEREAEVERLNNALTSALSDSARLTMENERLTRERDALERENERIKTEWDRDNYLRDGYRAEVERLRALLRGSGM